MKATSKRFIQSFLNLFIMDTKSLVKRKRKFKSTQLFVMAGTILVSLLISLVCVGLTVRYEVDTETSDAKSIQYWKLDLPAEQNYWFEKGIEELKSVIVKKENRGEVENVVIFMVEGVNSDMLSRARFVKKENTTEMHNFFWDSFPHLGILKSSCSLKKECDAFTVSTAIFGGVKTSKGLGGLDQRVASGNCFQASNETYHINSIFKQAQSVNLRTGFVTTRRVTAPLVAGLYAHSSNTQWECDASMPVASSMAEDCLDVASQLIKSQESRKINVIMGGGRQTLVAKVSFSNLSTIDESACISQDGRNHLQAWQSFKTRENVTFKLLERARDLERLKGSTWDYVLGIFSNGDLTDKDPKLTDMITKSLDILKRNSSGYILVADTEVKTNEVELFQQKLFKLDETIKETFKHKSFTPQNTVLLTLFLDLKHNGNISKDMLLYATGPKSYLVHGVHEETYMAHVISYYLKMGIFKPSTGSKRRINF